jgi:dTDP-4-amino-4,6-dideoxygalactose transaminase
VAVHLADSMADMDRLPALCEERGLLLVEDCAHAHGASWRGRRAGTLGDLGGFSMQSSKLLTAGEGGAVSTDDADYERRLRTLINCGRLAADGSGEPVLGHNLRLTEWQAAILREQLERLPEQHTRRRERRAVFARALSELRGLSLAPVDPRVSEPTCYQTIVRYDRRAFADAPRDAVIAALNAEGVPCAGRFYVPLPDDPLFARDPLTNPAVRAGVDYTGLSFPVAARAAYEEAIWLPHHLFLGTDNDARDVAAAFRKVQQGAEGLRDGNPVRG